MESVLNEIESARQDIDATVQGVGILPHPGASASSVEVQTYLRAVDAMRQARAVAARNISRHRMSGSTHVAPPVPKPGPLTRPHVVARPPSIVAKLHILRRKQDSAKDVTELETPEKKEVKLMKTKSSKPAFSVPTKLFPLSAAHQTKGSVERITPNPRIKATDTFPSELRDVRTKPTAVAGREFHLPKRGFGDSDATASVARRPSGDRSISIPITMKRKRPESPASSEENEAEIPFHSGMRLREARRDYDSEPINVNVTLPKEAFRGTQPPQAPAAVSIPIIVSRREPKIQSVAQPTQVQVPVVIKRAALKPAAPNDGTATALSDALQAMWKDMMGMLNATMADLKESRIPPPPTIQQTVMPATTSRMSDDLVLDMLATTCLQVEQQRGTRNTQSLRELLEDLRLRVTSLQTDVARVQASSDTCVSNTEQHAMHLTAVSSEVQRNGTDIQQLRAELQQSHTSLQDRITHATQKLATHVQTTSETIAAGVHAAEERLSERLEGVRVDVQGHTEHVIARDVTPALYTLADEVKKLRNDMPAAGSGETTVNVDLSTWGTQLAAGFEGVQGRHNELERKVDVIADEVQRMHAEVLALKNRSPRAEQPAAPAPAPAVLDEESLSETSSEASRSLGEVVLDSLAGAASRSGPFFAAVPAVAAATTSLRVRHPQGDLGVTSLAIADEASLLQELGDLPHLHEVGLEDLSAGEVVMAEDLSAGELFHLYPLDAHHSDGPRTG